MLAKGKTDTARAWVYVRDDKPFAGPDPPAALFRYSRDRSGDHPVEHLRTFAGILQADAYAGYRRLYEPGRSPGPVTEALVLEPWPAQVLRARRHRGRQEARQAGAADLAAGAGGCEADRRTVRYRA